jgi:hypothetical protein
MNSQEHQQQQQQRQRGSQHQPYNTWGDLTGAAINMFSVR